ncbi:MAG: hypothetical protein M9894_18845 [Planctomycetes bacterium]|nr:hypothetical protein [Planctomycetota bacterium]
MKLEVAPRPNERPTCVYCRAEVGSAEALVVCPACGSTLHAPCRTELRRCASPGCAGFDDTPPREDAATGRAARLAAARARREAEDAARDAAARAAGAPRPTRDLLWRAATGAELGKCAGVGAVVGLTIGLLVAYYLSGQRLAVNEVVRCCLVAGPVGAIEGLLIGLVGVRREPVRLLGSADDARYSLSAFFTAGCGLLGAWVVASLGGGTIPVLLAGVAAALLALTLGLRWFGL